MIFYPMVALVGAETVLFAILAVKPIRFLGMFLARLTKTRYGQVVSMTLGACIAVLFASSIISIFRAQQHVGPRGGVAGGGLEKLVEEKELMQETMEAMLMGFVIILGLFMDRYYESLRDAELQTIRLDTLKKQANQLSQEYHRVTGEAPNVGKVDAPEGGLGGGFQDPKQLETEMEQLKVELQQKDANARKAEADLQAMKKQTSGLQAEYDRLRAEKEHLQDLLASFDSRYSRSDAKKTS